MNKLAKLIDDIEVAELSQADLSLFDLFIRDELESRFGNVMCKSCGEYNVMGIYNPPYNGEEKVQWGS